MPLTTAARMLVTSTLDADDTVSVAATVLSVLLATTALTIAMPAPTPRTVRDESAATEVLLEPKLT